MDERVSYCRICEALCGVIASVEAGRLVSIRPDRDNPYSQGFICAKGVAMAEVQNDPDRIRTPLKRVGGPGEFRAVSWDEAISDIAGRLRELRRTRGPDSIAVYQGNPTVMNFGALLFCKGFKDAIGTKWYYSANAEDAAARFAANAILYGSPARIPFPDVRRTQFLLMLGANPWVSKGSRMHDPQIRDHMAEIVERGGRVVVVDPRRTETARRFEHVAIAPGTDPWFLISVLQVLIGEGLTDRGFIERSTSGFDRLAAFVAEFPPEATEELTGVPAAVTRDVAIGLGRAPAAAVYGSTGTCTQRFGTLTNVLQDAVNIATGNVQCPGGSVFGWAPVASTKMAERMGTATFAAVHTRVAHLPDAYGFLPSGALADEITVPGDGQVRALVIISGNPALSGPGGPDLIDALQRLELFVVLDIYRSETANYADYILPTTTFYETADAPLHFLERFIRPSLFATEAVADAPGECREEWQILTDIARAMGRGGAYSVGPLRWLAKLGVTITPRALTDLLIRTGAAGDWFGLRRSGLSFKKLTTEERHGRVLHEFLPIPPLREVIKHPDGKIQLADRRVLDELETLRTMDHQRGPGGDEFPLRLVGMRETRSHNTWMHNPEKLMPPSRKHRLRISPKDAATIGVDTDDLVTVTSKTGSVTIEVEVTDDMTPGAVAMPHGWGHNGSWRRANAAGGVCSNALASRHPEDLERIAAMTVLNGLPVRIERADHL